MKEKEINAHDWTKGKIKGELDDVGLTMSELSRNFGLKEGTLRNVFRVKYPKAQKIIADAIGVSPEIIWPSRY